MRDEPSVLLVSAIKKKGGHKYECRPVLQLAMIICRAYD
jgi:hypothetical protein